MASTPQWVKDAVFYGIFPDSFARDGTPEGWDATVLEPWDAPHGQRAYKGGDLVGAAKLLGHVASLGVTAVYLGPVNVSASYHRYKPADYFHVDPLLGGDEALVAFLAEARKLGLRVILDAVFNHVGLGFRPFQDVLEYGERSPYWHWFRLQGPPNPFDPSRPPGYECYEGNRSMPRLNHSHPGVREHLMRAAEHGIRLGASGWRLDCPGGIDAPGFWQELRARVRKLDPEAYLVGEIWGDASAWLDGTQWDAATNYPLMGALWRYAAGGRLRDEHLLPASRREGPLNGSGFLTALERLGERLSEEARLVQFNFVGTHDVARLRTAADPRTHELATLLLFGLPGAPCIFYGDEVGLEGGLAPACRRGFPAEEHWDQRLLDLHRHLGRVRRERPSLRRGGLVARAVSGGAVVLEREHGGERTLVVCNAADGAVDLTLPSGCPSEALVNVGVVPHFRVADGRLHLHLGARSAAIVG